MRTCYIPSPFGNLLLKTAIGADRTGKPPLRCSLFLHSSLTPLPGQWDRCQSCKYILGATFVIISRNFLITHHKSFGCVTITCHDRKLVLWCAIAARVAFYSQPGLLSVWCVCVCVCMCVCVCVCCLFTPFLSVLSVFHRKNLVL